MRNLSAIILLFITSQVFGQEENVANSMYFRTQPLWLITYRTIPFELEYFVSPKHSLSFEYAYSGYINPNREGLCIGCWLTDYAEQRQLLTLNYRYYVKYGLFISPYLRYRIWNGELSQYVEDTLNDEQKKADIQSNSVGAGLTIGARGKLGDIFDLAFYFGYGGYFHHTYPIGDYTISYELEQDFRLGFNLGVKLF